MTFKYSLLTVLMLHISFYVVGQAEHQDEEEYYESGTYVGVKGGMGLSSQLWKNQLSSNAIFTPGIDVFSETFDASSLSSFYAQLGYHQRGSGLGLIGRSFNSYRFHNLAIELGAKRIFHENENRTIYWSIGLRGEYTLGTNIASRTRTSIFNALFDEFVNKINYGVSLGIGAKKELRNQQVVFLELVFNPDFSNQYDQPFQLGPFVSPYNTAQSIFIDPQAVRNYSLELRVGYMWLR